MLQAEPRSYLLITRLPLPFLSTHPLNTLVYSPQFERETRSKFLQSCTNFFNTFHWLAVRALNALLRATLVSEHVPMPSEEDVVALVM